MNKLRELRQEKKLSLAKMSKEINISASLLGYYEREEREPKKETWEKLANYFKVSVPYLMGLTDTDEKKRQQAVKELTETIIELNKTAHGVELSKEDVAHLANLPRFQRDLNLFAMNLDNLGDDNKETTDTIVSLIQIVQLIFSKNDYEKISELKIIIENIRSIYIRSTSKETLYSKEIAIGKHLKNINEITDILNKWYMNEIDTIEYDSKHSHGLE